MIIKKLRINNEQLNNKLKMVFELSNQSIWKYNIQEMEKVKILRYENGGKYKWHTDCGSKETSLRKLTAIIQLSDETKYEGGNLEFGITDETGTKIIIPLQEHEEVLQSFHRSYHIELHQSQKVEDIH